MKGVGALTLGQYLLTACGLGGGASAPTDSGSPAAGDGPPPSAGAETDELGDRLTDYHDITHYNNFYEFSIHKESPAKLAAGLVTSPWAVQVGGLVEKPGNYDVVELKQRFDQEERIYRLRCVEGWSMVIPWIGFPLRKLLEEVEPTSAAKYVRFETLYDPDQMPGTRRIALDWPYVEGLRLDEAMHDLTLIATGIYGKDLLPQNGSPIRLVVPWKYGFKSIKSIVKIDLVEERPSSTWMLSAPDEYGFYANVNPEVDHPRWSQATERRIGELRRRKTLMFNGYEEEVAHLYKDQDLKVDF